MPPGVTSLSGAPVVVQEEENSSRLICSKHSSASSEDGGVGEPDYPVRVFTFQPTEQRCGTHSCNRKSHVSNVQSRTAEGRLQCVSKQTAIQMGAEMPSEAECVAAEECVGTSTDPLVVVSSPGQDTVVVTLRAYLQLPPTDALALLRGEDHTGTMVWQGSARMAQYIVDVCASRQRVAEAEAVTVAQSRKQQEGVFRPTRPPVQQATVGTSGDDPMASLCDVHAVVELGCGAGLLGIVAGAVLRPRHLILTDGDDECVALAKVNAQSHFGAADDCCSNNPTAAPNIVSEQLMWRELSPSETNELIGVTDETTKCGRSIVLTGGDIVYELESVLPLITCVTSIARNFLVARSSPLQSTRGAEEKRDTRSLIGVGVSNNPHRVAHFLLAFFPRTWHASAGRELLEATKSGLSGQGWVLVTDQPVDGDGFVMHFVLTT